ncbi:MAG TPA: hypothetical protein PK267_06170 [Atribacterota bacterium]|nr:hypothetical protein [Atribacterota bacterium]
MSMFLKNDWSGIVAIIFSFLIVYRFWKIKKDIRLSLTLGLTLFLHHVIAIINIYFITLPGAEGDPAKFYYHAEKWALAGKWDLSIGTNFYTQFLGIFYRIFGPSKLLGAELSILFFLLTCLVLIEIAGLLNINKYTVPVLLVYGLLPTNLIFCSKILRESYQIFFFISTVYWGLRYRLESTKNSLIFCLISSLLMAFFQRALVVYALVLIAIILLWNLYEVSGSYEGKRAINKKKLIVISLSLIFILGIIITGIAFKVEDIGAVEAFLKGKGFQFAADYRARLLLIKAPDARANYGILLDTSTVTGFLKSTVFIYIYYLFSPFPWQIENFLDLYSFFESLLRFILIGFSILLWHQEKDRKKRSIWSMLLFIYFSMAFLWAMGTINYGQAIRHHLITNWLIIILSLPGLINFFVGNYRRLKTMSKVK